MKFSFAHISDIHIGSYQGKIESGGLNGRFLDFVQTFHEAIDYVVDSKLDFCLIPGDIFRSKMPMPDELNEFAKGLVKLIKAKIPTIISLGNHDLFLAEKRTHSLGVVQTLLEDSSITISAKPEIIKLDVAGGTIQIQVQPYPIRSVLKLKTNEEVSKYVEDSINSVYKSRDTKLPIIFAGHFTISDSVVGDEQRYVDKFKEPIINKGIFKGKKYLYGAMGHLHKHQTVCTKPLVMYSGSNNRVDFNEAKEDKGFVRIDIDGNSVDAQFVKVNARKFVDLKYDLEMEDEPLKIVMDDMKNREKEIDNSIVRFSVILSEENESKYSSRDVSDFLDKHCYWMQGTTVPAIKKKRLSRDSAGFKESMSAVQALGHYANINNITDKEEFLRLGEEIIKGSEE